MKVNILIDNNSIDKNLLTEHGLSIYIEKNNKKILFDTGATNAFLENAEKMHVDLSKIDYVVLSHGHDDHSGGLEYLLNFFNHKPKFISCPNIFCKRYDDEDGEFGIRLTSKDIEKSFDVIYSAKPYYLSEEILFLGEIPRLNNFEGKTNVGWNSITKEKDYVTDDSALVIKHQDGLIIITGCSHSGILNICDYAKKIFKTEKIISIIGGLHLKDSTIDYINATVNELKILELNSIYACHCTGLIAQEVLKNQTPFKETGSGLEIQF